MSYLALATDHDGTIATEGRLEPETLAGLRRWQEAGRKLILVTGRMLDDLLTILPQYAPLELFDWIVVENGAVLYHPTTQAVQILTTPTPAEFIQQLRQQIGNGAAIYEMAGASEFSRLVQSGELAPFTAGRVIVATWQPYDQTANQLIQEMQLDLQVILNKRAVMVLPTGVDKAFGLKAALQELNLAPEQVVGVGDAENDCHFLEVCGFAAAVANALPLVKQQVDWVATQARGAGVVELIDYLLGQEGAG
jgi:HAD superfamily hydrolase (TIGR01484 family)